MRHTLALAWGIVCLLLLLLLPASAGAAITTTNAAPTLAGALASSSVDTSNASFSELPPSGTPHGTGDTALGDFPNEGPFTILTSGDAALADDANTDESSGAADVGPPGHGFAGATGNAQDTSVLRINLNVPTGATCLQFEFRFLSDEFEENVGFTVNDGFLAMLDNAGWTTDLNGDISAPTNFAFDQDGALVSVNTASRTVAAATGTTYDAATQVRTAGSPITPGPHILYLAIFDQGDQSLDSAVFIDNLRFSDFTETECRQTVDRVNPAVTLDAPAGEPTAFSGQAGTAATDSQNVTVQVYSGPSVSGAPIVVQPGTLDTSGAYSTESLGGFGPGTYTVQAHQTDTAGNVGVSPARTFSVGGGQPTQAQPTPSAVPTVTPPPPPPPVEPKPVLGQSVVGGVVSGRVRVKLKNGSFHVLGADESIPLGSTVDATKGKVMLTAAAGAGAVQAGTFYSGAFVVTQTGGKAKPVTQLALTGALSCPKAKASSSAGKKVRRLWGEGKGRFRTRGRHGAATVRGTKWLTEDRCDSTKITVKQGTVVVRDFAKKKNKIVKKGQSYVARAKAKRKRKTT